METQQGFVQRAFVPVIVGVVIVGLLVGGYFAFRRTLIADVRESLMNVDTTDTVAYGATLFQTRGCVGCHTLESAGATGDEGPNLSHIASRADADYIRESILTPNAVIADDCPEGACPAGLMPQYGSILTPAQVDALVAYLMQQQ
jgi:mono/diheme cytochrome c family protein